MVTILGVLLLLQDVDAAVDRLAAVKAGDGAAYVAARDKVLAFGPDAIPALAAAGHPDRWTETGWVRALAAESCRLRLASPGPAEAVDRLDGIDPATYRLFRHGKPMLLPSMKRIGGDAVPLLIERWRWTFDLHRFSEGAAGDAERDTFRTAVLALPGQLPDTRAIHFLADVLASAGLDDAWRRDAAVSLAMAAGLTSLPRIAAVLDDAALSSTVREGCARAIGRIPDPAALDAIRSRLPGEKDAQVRRSLLHGLGLLGSSWGWESRGQGAAAMADAVRSGCAETLVESIRRHPAEAETIGTALALTAWAPSLKPVEALAADAAPEVREAAGRILPRLRAALSRIR